MNQRMDALISHAEIATVVQQHINDNLTTVIQPMVSTAISDVMASTINDIRAKSTNLHNIDNNINSVKQRIEGDLTSFRSTAESVTDLQQQVNDIDKEQNDIISDVRKMQLALRDKGIMYVTVDDDDVDEDTADRVGNNITNDNNNHTNNNDDDNVGCNNNNDDANVDSHTAPRSLDTLANTLTPASRAIQAHTTGQRFKSSYIHNKDPEDHTAEDRIGPNYTTEVRSPGHAQNNNYTNRHGSDYSHTHRNNSDDNRNREEYNNNNRRDEYNNNRDGHNNNSNYNRDGYYNSYNNSPSTRADHHTSPPRTTHNSHTHNPYTRPYMDTSPPRWPHYATSVREYQGSHEGIMSLSDDILDYCGYNTNAYSVEDVSTIYNDIKSIHRHVASGWYQYQSYQSHDAKEEGPQVQRIVAKNLSVFPKLHSTSMPAVIDFYDRLQRVSYKYLMPLTPFNHILLHHKSVGLCIPHLGYANYQVAAAGLLELLPHLIPTSLSKNFNANIASINSTSKNGYDVVWNILFQSVPGFDPSKSLPAPTWTPNHDIFDFSEEFTTFFRVQRLLKIPQSDSTKSLMFLNAISSPEYIETVGILTTAVESKVFDDNNSPLPPHLQLHGLATRLAKITTSRVSAAITPYANRTFGPSSQQHWEQQGSYPSDSNPYTHGPTIDPYYEAYEVNRVGDQRVRFDSNTQQSQGRDTYGRTRYPRSPSAGPRSDTTGVPPILRGSPSRAGVQQPTQGRQRRPMPNPSRNNRRPYVSVQCRACKRVGHDEQNCDMLAMAIALHQYRRDHLTPDLMNSIEHEWMERHRARLDNVTQTPRQVLRAYADDNDYTTADIDAAIDWSIWEDDTPEDQNPVE